MKITKLLVAWFTCLYLTGPLLAQAEVAVIVHPSNTAVMDKDTIKRVFLGKIKEYSTGEKAIPLDQEKGSSANKEFLKKVLKKSKSQLRAYWSKLIFTGKGRPPREVGSDSDVIDLVSKNPNLIGYIDTKNATADVRVVAKF